MATLIDEAEMAVPRLELRWHKKGDSWSESICIYALILPLQERDVRGEVYNDAGELIGRDTTLSVEISAMEQTGPDESPLDMNGPSGPEILTPYRDGAHARWDAKALGNLPVYAVCEGKAMLVDSSGK